MPLLHPAAKHPIARVARNTGRATFELFFHNNNSLCDAMDEEQRRQSDENPVHTITMRSFKENFVITY